MTPGTCHLFADGHPGSRLHHVFARMQRQGVRPAPALAGMRARHWPGEDYRSQPRWLQALGALRSAGLID